MSHGRFQSFQTKAPSLCYEGESVGVRFDKVYGISVSLFLQTSAQQMRTAFLKYFSKSTFWWARRRAASSRRLAE
jgi:hypothetical protein